MLSVKRRRGGVCQLTFTGELTIYAAEQLKERLADPVGKCKTALELDLTGVPELDTAALQVLLSARKSCAQAGKDFRVAACSPAVAEVIGLYGLAHAFGVAQMSPAGDEGGQGGTP